MLHAPIIVALFKEIIRMYENSCREFHDRQHVIRISNPSVSIPFVHVYRKFLHPHNDLWLAPGKQPPVLHFS